MLAGQGPQVEVQARPAVKPLVQEPIHPLGRRQSQLQVELQVELLEVTALEALEDHLIPSEARQGQGGFVGLRAPAIALARLPRARRGPPTLPVVERHIVEDVELLVDPALGRVVPPRVLVHQHHADPSVQRFLDPTVALSALGPPQQLDQLVARELDPRVGEVAPTLGQLDQADQHLVIQRGRQAMLVRPHDRESADDRRAVVPLHPILEHHGRLAVGDAVRQGGNRELRQVELILPARVRRGDPLVTRLVELTGLFQRHVPLVHPAAPSQGVIRAIALFRPPLPPVFLVQKKKNTNKPPAAVLLSFFLNKSL